jgi:hypothetical protein
MGRRRGGGSREPLLHADAQRLLAAGAYPPRVQHPIVLARRGGRPGQQVCRVCGTTARHGQCWVPPELLHVASASTRVYSYRCLRMTRGQCGWLDLHCLGLAPFTTVPTCPGAYPSHGRR